MENGMCYYFNDMINITGFTPKTIKKQQENI